MTVIEPVKQTNLPAESPARRRWLVALLAVIGLLGVGTAAYFAAGTGLKTRMLEAVGIDGKVSHPRVTSARPAHREGDVPLDSAIAAQVSMPNGGLDPATLTADTVYLVRAADQEKVPTEITTYGNDMVMVRPLGKLDPATKYTLVLTREIRDVSGVSVVPGRISFTTTGNADPTIRFDKVALPTVPEGLYTAVTIGDGRTLYAGTVDGRILRFAIQSDGTLGEPRVSDALVRKHNGPRLIGGIAFDPSSTPQHPVLWVTHTFMGFKDVPDFTGGLSRISGPELEDVQDVLINLPRSSRDHITFQPIIGPDGALYFHQGSNSAYGAPDAEWGNREEHLLSASVLRLDLSKITPETTLDARTIDAGGTYDPFSEGAPLTVYATGVRVAYDMVWTTTGRLIAPVNGSSAGGNSPAGPGVPGLTAIPTSENDYLHEILPGKYYGHPNPRHNRFVLNGGNPTDGIDIAEIEAYPVGTLPDPDYRTPLYDFGQHVSPNGILEYQHDIFDGKLKGAYIVCRYNFGSDLIVLHPDPATGAIVDKQVGITGMTGLNAPLDLVEDPANGNIYVSEFGAKKITLLRPAPTMMPALAAP